MDVIDIEEKWFNHIFNGRKTIEGRLYKNKYKSFCKGIKTLRCNDKSFTILIEDIYIYSSFEEYLSMEGLKATLPDVLTIEDGIKIYRDFIY